MLGLLVSNYSSEVDCQTSIAASLSGLRNEELALVKTPTVLREATQCAWGLGCSLKLENKSSLDVQAVTEGPVKGLLETHQPEPGGSVHSPVHRLPQHSRQAPA